MSFTVRQLATGWQQYDDHSVSPWCDGVRLKPLSIVRDGGRVVLVIVRNGGRVWYW